MEIKQAAAQIRLLGYSEKDVDSDLRSKFREAK